LRIVLAIIMLSLMPIGIAFLQQQRRKAQPADTPGAGRYGHDR
jgi:hypothetical protein